MKAKPSTHPAPALVSRDKSAFLELPKEAQLPINRCNLPAAVLGSIEFQQHPSKLELDGIQVFHGKWFAKLASIDNARVRAERFMAYVDLAFRLATPEYLGFEPNGPEKRLHATCFRMIRGWSFDSNGPEAAVLKGWVESRFGLRARYHNGWLGEPYGELHSSYALLSAIGTWGTAGLESQLDLLYMYCQREFSLAECPAEPPCDTIARLKLFRGIGHLSELEVIRQISQTRMVVLLNNLSSFTSERERAEEFGRLIVEVHVPTSKVFFHNRLIPHLLTGEDEFMVIGGLYEATVLPY